jgi:hypothetical protein
MPSANPAIAGNHFISRFIRDPFSHPMQGEGELLVAAETVAQPAGYSPDETATAKICYPHFAFRSTSV